MNNSINNLSSSEPIKKIDFLLIFLLFQINWISLFLTIPKLEYVIFIFIFVISYRIYNKIIFDYKILGLLLIYSFIALIQGLIWDFSLLSLVTSFIAVFLLPYYLYVVYKGDILTILERVIRLLTIIALVIWLAHQFIPHAKDLIQIVIAFVNKNTDPQKNLIRGMFFYTYWPGLDQDFGLSRNAGFASEPGSFAAYLVLGIIINYVRQGKLLEKKQLVYYFALLTTFSTAGYLSLLILGLLLIKQRGSAIQAIILFPLFIIAAVIVFNNLDFMKEKIQRQYEDQTEISLNEPTDGRIMGARKSLYVLTNHPLFGRGLLSITKPKEANDPEYSNYGWLNEISRFGIILGAIFLFYFFKGFYYFIRSGGHGKYSFFVIVFALMINLSSQSLITAPFFIIFFFFGIYDYKVVQLSTFSKRVI